MATIIKHASVTDDNWQLVTDKDITDKADLPDGDLLLPLAVWQRLQDETADRNMAIWLDSDDDVHAIGSLCQHMQLIGINFPAFADGRGYSIAAILRQQYNYQGELRAIGDVLRDQVFYLKRVGFDSFALRNDQDLQQSLGALKEFRHSYQASSDQPEPLFRKRA